MDVESKRITDMFANIAKETDPQKKKISFIRFLSSVGKLKGNVASQMVKDFKAGGNNGTK